MIYSALTCQIWLVLVSVCVWGLMCVSGPTLSLSKRKWKNTYRVCIANSVYCKSVNYE